MAAAIFGSLCTMTENRPQNAADRAAECGGVVGRVRPHHCKPTEAGTEATIHSLAAEYLPFLGLFGSSRAVRQIRRICAQCGGTVTDRPATINCVPADRLLDDNG